MLTIPFSLPYQVSEGSYERVHGDFEYAGEYYKLVKQKLENDTLFIVCVKDKEAKLIEESLSDYSKQANNLPVGSEQASNFLSKLFKDFHTDSKAIITVGYTVVLKKSETTDFPAVLQGPHSIDTPPPELFPS